MAGIRFDGVTKRFDDVVAVSDLSLDVADGEFLVLLGPSGCGKSTALRIVAGLETPDAGDVLIDDEVVNDVDAKDRDLAMVFQSYALYPHMTVRRNITFSLKPLGIARDERDRRAEVAAAQLGLSELLDRKPGQLSGGQRQRVALARAIVRQPRAFLMDEPLSNLDAKLRTETRVELVHLHERLGTTVIYVTHDQVEAMTMADRVAILLAGELQQDGSPDEIYRRPANLFVASFIGNPAMNLLPAKFFDNGTRCLDIGGTRVELTAGCQRRGLAGEVIVGVRPEDVMFAQHGVAGRATAVESLGYEKLVTCELEMGATSVVRIDARAPGPVRGEVVHLAPDPAAVTLFDPVTGNRLS